MKYPLTEESYRILQQKIEKLKQKLQEIRSAKAEAHQGQDSWHDEGFKLGSTQERKCSRRIGDYQRILRNAEMFSPEEQDTRVQFGNGVRIRFSDGTERQFILDGYHLLDGRISVLSPLGKAIVGSKQGEERTFEVDGEERRVRIEEIILPSTAKKNLKNGGGR